MKILKRKHTQPPQNPPESRDPRRLEALRANRARCPDCLKTINLVRVKGHVPALSLATCVKCQKVWQKRQLEGLSPYEVPSENQESVITKVVIPKLEW